MASLAPSHSCLIIHQAKRYTLQNTAHSTWRFLSSTWPQYKPKQSQKPSVFSTKAISRPLSKLRFNTMIRNHYQFIVQEQCFIKLSIENNRKLTLHTKQNQVKFHWNVTIRPPKPKKLANIDYSSAQSLIEKALER